MCITGCGQRALRDWKNSEALALQRGTLSVCLAENGDSSVMAPYNNRINSDLLRRRSAPPPQAGYAGR